MEHLAPIAFAFLLPYISYQVALLLCLAAVFHALFVSPRWIRVTTRPAEARAGFSAGKLYYASSVLILLLVFPDRMYIVAGVWAILAVGDSLSNLIGRRWSATPLPYNPRKTLAGLITFWLSGGLAAWLLLWWNLPEDSAYSAEILLWFALVSAFFSSLAESLPPVVNDNLIVSWVAAICFALLFSIQQSHPQLTSPLAEAVFINCATALLAVFFCWISLRGILLALAFGVLIYAALGWGAYLMICMFLLFGSVSTRLGIQYKKSLHLAEQGNGRRGILNVLGNGVIPSLIALFGLWIRDPVLIVAYGGAVATATFDTVATEMGQWLGKRPVSPLDFRVVRPGTAGAVSWEGSLAGLLAALLIALIPTLAGGLSLSPVFFILAGALAGGLGESVIASTLHKKPDFGDQALNIYNTLMGAFVSGVLWLSV